MHNVPFSHSFSPKSRSEATSSQRPVYLRTMAPRHIRSNTPSKPSRMMAGGRVLGDACTCLRCELQRPGSARAGSAMLAASAQAPNTSPVRHLLGFVHRGPDERGPSLNDVASHCSQHEGAITATKPRAGWKKAELFGADPAEQLVRWSGHDHMLSSVACIRILSVALLKVEKFLAFWIAMEA